MYCTVCKPFFQYTSKVYCKWDTRLLMYKCKYNKLQILI